MKYLSDLTAAELRAKYSYDEKTGIFTRLISRSRFFPPGTIAGSQNPNGYTRLKINGREYLAHRLAWLSVYGKWPDGEVDHINGNRSDNRIENLRDVSRRENALNARIAGNNKSGIRGVYFCRRSRKWRAYIHIDGKRTYLGRFLNKAVAKSVRKKAELDNGFHPNHGRAAA